MSMEASSTASPLPQHFEMPAWKTMASHITAFFIAMLFIGAGVWKATDPYGWADKVENLLVMRELSLPLAIALGLVESLAGVLILVPRFRRWGSLLTMGLLAGFMIYIGVNYQALKGQDCTCFPPIHLPFGIVIDFTRAVGPEFFLGDAAMMVAAALAGWWARPSKSFRTAGVILGALTVFAGVSFGVAYTQKHNVQAPESVVVDGKPMSLREGRFFLFFYNPTCTHCMSAAETMGKLKFKDTTVIAFPLNDPQWAEGFLTDTKFTVAKTSLEAERLRQIFPFENYPYGVIIEDGRQTGIVDLYDENGEPEKTLRTLGAIE
jgi:uncharacterized membrane protein YphA (DoxX/SURF4 family)